jgi:PAS domain S-box-containing protein
MPSWPLSDDLKQRIDGFAHQRNLTPEQFLTQILDNLEHEPAALREIDEQKKLEAELRLSTLALESSPLSVMIADAAQPDTPVIYVNPAFERITGYSRDEVIGKNSRFLQGNLERQPALDELLSALKAGRECTVVLKNFRKDGTLFWNELHIAPIFNGTLTHFIGFQNDVTTYQTVTEKLRQREADLTALFNSTFDAILIADNTGCYVDVNRAATQMLGLPRDEIIGKNIADFSTPEVKENFPSIWQAFLASQVQEGEFDLILPDGRLINTQFFARVNYIDGYHVSFIQDITQRKQAEIALKESEIRYKSMIAALSEGVVLQAASGEIITCNASAERILGLTKEQMIGRASIDPRWRAIKEDGSAFPGEEHPSMITLRTGQAQHNVMMGVHKPDNSLTWISINTQPLCQPDQTTPYAVIASFTDITDQYLAMETLKLNEERYRIISELASDYAYAYRVEPDGSLVCDWITDSFKYVTGYSLDESNLIQHLEIFHPDDRPRVHQDRQQALGGATNNGEYRIMTREGEERWVQINRYPIWDSEQGRVVRLYSVAHDITFEKRAEFALLEQKQMEAILRQEQEMNRVHVNLMRTISHEFKVPLSVISISAEMLNKYFERYTPEQRAEKLDNILENSRRMAQLVDDVSLLVRGAFHQLTLQPALINLDQLCRASLREMQGTIGAKHHLLFVTDEQVTYAWVDEKLVSRILINLLSNAVKYSPEHSEIELGLRRDHLVLTVSDHGMGIPPQEQNHIFEPFYRTSTVKNLHGTGLGLSIVKDCIELHGGTITFNSAPGQGTVFTVRIPLSTAGRSHPVIPAEIVPPTGSHNATDSGLNPAVPRG